MSSTLHDYWHDYIERAKKVLQSDPDYDIEDFETFPPVTTEEIKAFESEQNIKLPNSYKALLEVSNGLRMMTDFHSLEDVVPTDFDIDIWYEQINDEDGEYQCAEEDTLFFYNRHREIVNREGKKVPYPPKECNEYLFSDYYLTYCKDTDEHERTNIITDVNGNQLSNISSDAFIRGSSIKRIMMGAKQPVLRYKDAYDLIDIGGDGEYDFYCFNPNLEPEEGEPEIWLASFHEAFMGDEWCYKFLNFTEFAEYLLLDLKKNLEWTLEHSKS